MRTFLVLEGASRLESGEADKLTGTVLTESALIEWAARWLGTPPDAPFLTVADAARAQGVALFGLPTRDVKRSDPDAETVEAVVEGRTVLVIRRRGDSTGPARVRWQGEDGGVREVEVPCFLADALAKGPPGPATGPEPADSTADPNDAPDAPEGPGDAPGDAPRKSRRRKADKGP